MVDDGNGSLVRLCSISQSGRNRPRRARSPSRAYRRVANAVERLIHFPSLDRRPLKEPSKSKFEANFPADRLALYERDRYSAAIRSGELLFISGRVEAQRWLTEPDFEAQVRLPG